MEGGGTDSVSTNNGTPTSVTFSTGNGKILQGAGMTTASKIEVPHASSLSPTTAITLACWVNTTSTGGQYHTMIAKGNTAQYILRVDGANNKYEVYLNLGGVLRNAKSTSSVVNGSWKFIVATYDGSAIKMYVDGTLETTASFSGSIGTGSAVLGLGMDITDGGSNVHLVGALDEVGMWSRALSDSEVTQLYNTGTGLTYPFGPAADYLIVAGGGGGGGDVNGGGRGGGGAGGVRKFLSQPLSAGTYPVVVGSGGLGATSLANNATNGGDSSFNGATSVGGGKGGAETNSGATGGSGGGAGYASGSAAGAGTAGQGYAGGDGTGGGPNYPGSGGGGASAVGAACSGSVAGAGGAGLADSITGASVTYGGGGGGAVRTSGTAGAGGAGGGGAGTGTTNGNGANGTANTGGGGGASEGSGVSGNGGSGVVIVRLLTADWYSITGGTQTTDGAYTVCTFNSSGDLVLSSGKTADVLVVAGGGGGGYTYGGGGGAGGLLYTPARSITAGSYSVTVGAGGTKGTVSGAVQAANGGDSQFSSDTLVKGGGGGGSNGAVDAPNTGGSGGGGSYSPSTGAAALGTQGFAGGNGGGATKFGGGGGGGSSAVGGAGSGSAGGPGGAGTANSISGASVTYAGGGGAGCENGGTGGTGGTGGGGAGSSSGAGTNGTTNTGGGGGGGAYTGTQYDGGDGGSGVVIVRLLTSDWTTITGGTQTTDGAYTVCTFNSSGTLILSESAPSINSGFFRLI